MLTPEEEQRLDACIDFSKAIEEGKTSMPPLGNVTILWLAEKLKEVNRKLKLQSDNSDHRPGHCNCWMCM